MSNQFSRRQFTTITLAGFATLAMGGPASAFSTGQAETLIGKVIADINRIINSGRSEASMLGDFEKLFGRYADRDRIGQLVLGVDGRSASASQKKAFAKAFQTYISRKYGRRFREFVGGKIELQGAKAIKSVYKVTTIAHLKGEAPFEVVFVVADSNGRFIDIEIEGIKLVLAERTEIGAMLDRRKGNLDQLIADLKKAS